MKKKLVLTKKPKPKLILKKKQTAPLPTVRRSRVA